MNSRSRILNSRFNSEAFMASFIGLFFFTPPVVRGKALRL